MKFDYDVLVAIDFDGTLTYPHKLGMPYKLRPKAIKWCKRVQKLGVKLILWTCRNRRSLGYPLRDLHAQGIWFDHVNDDNHKRNSLKKINADVYVDDKSYPGRIPWLRLYLKVKRLIRLRAKGVDAE